MLPSRPKSHPKGLGIGRPDAEAVNVISRGPTGLTDVGNQMWHQGALLEGAIEPYERFGIAPADRP